MASNNTAMKISPLWDRRPHPHEEEDLNLLGQKTSPSWDKGPPLLGHEVQQQRYKDLTLMGQKTSTSKGTMSNIPAKMTSPLWGKRLYPHWAKNFHCWRHDIKQHCHGNLTLVRQKTSPSWSKRSPLLGHHTKQCDDKRPCTTRVKDHCWGRSLYSTIQHCRQKNLVLKGNLGELLHIASPLKGMQKPHTQGHLKCTVPSQMTKVDHKAENYLLPHSQEIMGVGDKWYERLMSR